jgi:hypothetical protein
MENAMTRFSLPHRLAIVAVAGLFSLGAATSARATADVAYNNPDCLTFSIQPSGPDFVLVCNADTTNFDNNVASTIERYYTSILGRGSDVVGKTHWTSEVARLKGLGARVPDVFVAMAVTFFNSAEYTSRNTSASQFVTDLYNAFFGRAPDPEGLAYWLTQLDSGFSRGALLNTFLFSGEYLARMQTLFGAEAASRAEVAMVVDYYRGLLGRLPDDGGFNSWVGQFRVAQCAGSAAVTAKASEISASFIGSTEYVRKNQAFLADQDRAYVSDLYNAFMKRGGDLPGFNYWVTEIRTGSRTRENVRLQFVAATEFQTRVAAVIAQGCLP